MRIEISNIKVSNHYRDDLGDIAGLVKDIQEFGLLHPIIVDEKFRLIAGLRRLRAHQAMKQKMIEVKVIKNLDEYNKLRVQQSENSFRKPLKISEAVALGKELERMEKERAEKRQKSGKAVAPEEKGRVTEKVGEAVGLKRKGYEKAREIVEAVSKNSKYKELVEELDSTGKIDTVYRKFQELQGKAEKSKSKKEEMAENKVKHTGTFIEEINLLMGKLKEAINQNNVEFYKDTCMEVHNRMRIISENQLLKRIGS